MAKRKKIRGRKSKQAKSRQPLITPKTPSFQQQWKQTAKLIREGDLTRAEPLCAALIRQRPDDLHTLKVTGILRYYQHRYTEAISLLERVYAVDPQDIQTRRMLISSYQDGKQDKEALTMAGTLLDHPLTVEETMLAFNVFHELCDWQTSASMQDDLIRKIRAVGAKGITLGPSFLLALNGLDNTDPDTLFELHGFHGIRKPSVPLPRTFTPGQLNPRGRLKIAYLSPDFNTHPVAYFIYPVIAAHNRQNVEVYCYAHLIRQDDITDKFREAADHFIDITAMTHAEAAQRIQADGIHVLIDLAGHTANSRLPALRWKPAPVQVSWLGYPNTSGIPEVDFHITDHYAECEGGTRYTEQLLYMPESFICFGMRPTCLHAETAPVESTGFITFGSFANTRKMNPRVIGAWSRILNRVPNSRMALKNRWHSDKVHDYILAEFARHGVDDTRLLFLPTTDTYDEHVDQYNQIDIALDTFPYTGTTTTCEALLMGVPVVTLIGKTHANRVSYSILKNIGFETTVARTMDDYVDKAVTLAINPGGLSVLRKTLPTLFEYSIVGQPERFTPQLEELYMDACRRKGVNLSALGSSTVMENAESQKTKKQDAEGMPPESLHPNTYLAAFLRQRLAVPNITIAEIGARIINAEGTSEPAELFHTLPEARVIAFEPDRDACENINLLADQFPANIQAYPYTVGGINGRQMLYETNAGMCSSLYKPNETLLRRFMNLEVSYLKDTREIDVITLDTFMAQEGVDEIDFIKIGVQGAELDVFKGGEQALQGVIGICTEVEWAELYEGQPLFADVDLYLREHGFQMHHFIGAGTRPLKGSSLPGIQQHLWSDAVYFPSFERIETLSADKLIKLAVMATLYDAYGLSMHALERYDTLTGSKLSTIISDHFHPAQATQDSAMDVAPEDLQQIPDWVFVVGMVRSASTWCYNVVREMFECNHIGTIVGFVGEGEAIDRVLRTNSAVGPQLIKFHTPTKLALELLRAGQAKAVYTQRDLRDVTVSLMQFEKTTFRQLIASHRLQGIMEGHKLWRGSSNLKRVEYQEAMHNPKATIQEIGKFIGFNISVNDANKIAEACGIKAAHARMAQIVHNVHNNKDGIKTQDLGNGSCYDTKTLLHANHITSGGKTGYYKECLNRKQVNVLNALLKDWLIAEHYENRPLLDYENVGNALVMNIVGNIQVCVPNDLNLMTPYVLTEQKDWFEDEIKFIRKLIKLDMKVLDIGANYGCYAMTMAHLIGDKGHLWAFEPASSTAAFLTKSISTNGFSNVTLVNAALSNRKGTAELSLTANSELNSITSGAGNGPTESVPLMRLDDCIDSYQWQNIEFVKMDAEGEEIHILEGGSTFFSSFSPLVMFELKHGDQINEGLIQKFMAYGYRTYALVPGLQTLAPFNHEDQMDPYQLNLFCCKDDRASELEQTGLLIRTMKVDNINIPEGEHWRKMIQPFPYAKELMPLWDARMNEGEPLPGWLAYREALNAYALALQPGSVAKRYGYLKSAFVNLVSLLDEHVNLPRLLTLARVAAELGQRGAAVQVLKEISKHVEQEPNFILSEPFLAVSSMTENTDPEERPGDWCLAQVLAQNERLQAFSSYFTGDTSLPALDIFLQLGFEDTEMRRRYQLIKMRQEQTPVRQQEIREVSNA